MRKALFILSVILLFASCNPPSTALREPTEAELEQGFANPPAAAKPHTWWHWMNGNISKEGITADLEAMADAGIGGAQIFNVAEGIPHGAVQFNSAEWIDMVAFAAAEARRLGLEICIHNCAGWANSGGPWNTPENGMKIVVTSDTIIHGPTTLNTPPTQPQTNLDFYRDIAVLTFPTPSKTEGNVISNFRGKVFLDRQTIRRDREAAVIPPETFVNAADIRDLTANLLPADGKAPTWDVPEGDWTVLRIGYTANGRKNHPAPEEGTGLESDKLSQTATKAHWDGHVAKILEAVGTKNIDGKTGLNNVLIDSYEVGTQNWTQGLETEFQKRTGYSIVKFLPVFAGLIVDSPEITERFLWDFRRVVADLFAENYSEYFGKLAHDAGLLYSIEPYGNCPSDDIQYGSYSDIPMGEFWPSGGHSVNTGNAKLPASIAHVYGRKFVGAEAFTAAPNGGKWLKTPFDIKAQGDAVYCGGVNRMIYHRYAHQPWTNPTRYPGMTMGQWGTHFERTLTWWKQGKDWLKYQARCQYLLQEGQFVADVLFFSGEGAPNELRNTELPDGYDYDGCDTRALSLLTVKNGRLTLPSGMSYRLLALPNDEAFSPQTLKIIANLAAAGATITGYKKPEKAVGLRGYPDSDTEVKLLADELWPKIITGKSVGDVLASLGVKPDFKAPASANLKYIHRKISGADVYFVACPSLSGDATVCTFRVSGKIPELWNPETGAIEPAPVYSETDSLTSVPIRFEPSGATFVVFRKPAPADHLVAVKRIDNPVNNPDTSAGTLIILKAEYGDFADNTNGCANVTATVGKLLADGKRTFTVSNTTMGGDPAYGTVKEFRIDYMLGGTKKREFVNEDKAFTMPQGATLVKAYYGIINDEPDRQPQVIDITAKVAALVKGGALMADINNDLAGHDPAPMLEKTMRVNYTFNGEPGYLQVHENHTLVLPPRPEGEIPVPDYELKATAEGNTELLAWTSATFELKAASGKTLITEVKTAEPQEVTGTWNLTFPPNWGAPEQVTLDKLISWTEHPDDGVKYFSGTATYSISFSYEKPAEDRVVLDLGNLKNFAEVALNGTKYPVLWKPPYRLDITDAVKSGDNALTVEITNLWPNRLIGDEQLPDDRQWNGIRLKEWPQWVLDGKPSPTGRYTFTTWHHWRKDDKPLPSGLFGPVLLRRIASVAL
ncbi:MAG: DUF3395 domain-containing protein [Bacteroidales bacterium]|jgi:hypothetical protein|nr:DUF3395 domain-containing protein [Bacteroidales bacterium]